ncbi:GHKL domain-containing protein [Enterococcus faecalis]|uniref:GHKL domain-containing protein n=1 Tax=Enterococcus faecalis TaxID=1351 RepID=UPI0029387326|nr:GHKL domain-containing protein [Enterococcus faecalis]
MTDNTFEAVKIFDVFSSKRFIDYSINCNEYFKSITITNTCNRDIDISNFLTQKFATKDNCNRQGLIALNKIVKRNNSTLDFSSRNGCFDVSIKSSKSTLSNLRFHKLMIF